MRYLITLPFIYLLSIQIVLGSTPECKTTIAKFFTLSSERKESILVGVENLVAKLADNDFYGKIYDRNGKSFIVGDHVGSGVYGDVYNVSVKDIDSDLDSFPETKLIIKFANNLHLPRSIDPFYKALVAEVDEFSLFSKSKIIAPKIIVSDLDSSVPFIIKEFIEGTSIDKLGLQQEILSAAQIRSLRDDIFAEAEELWEKHNLGLDIKPQNLAWNEELGKFVMFELSRTLGNSPFFIAKGFEGYLEMAQTTFRRGLEE